MSAFKLVVFLLSYYYSSFTVLRTNCTDNIHNYNLIIPNTN